MANMFECRKKVSGDGGSGNNLPYLGLYLDWDNVIEFTTETEYEFTTPSKGVFILSYVTNSNALEHKIPGTNRWRRVLGTSSSSEYYTISNVTQQYISAKAGTVFKIMIPAYQTGILANVFVPFKDQNVKVLNWVDAVYFEQNVSSYVIPTSGAVILSSPANTLINNVLVSRQGCVYVPEGSVITNIRYPAWFVPFESD